jgi:putative ABC transport system permease protein
MGLFQFISTIELGLVYGLVAMGVFLSFKTLNFPDMTVDGSFTLGAGVCAALIIHGVHPGLATFAAVFAGALAGWVTAWLSTHLRILNLLAGILMMLALYSINLRIMGRPNIALSAEKTIVTEWFSTISFFGSVHLMPLMGVAVVLMVVVYFFLNTRLGLAMRATGNNPRMSRAQGVNDHRMIWLGLGISNALVALAGALYAQIHGFADVTLGMGTIIYGLAAVIIGSALLPARTIFQALSACVLGAIFHRLAIASALNVNIGLLPSDLNLVTVVLIIFALLLPTLTQRVKSLS